MHLDHVPAPAAPDDGAVALDAVREVSDAVSAAHLFIYLVPESAEEAARLGVTEQGRSYLAFRSAAMGAVPWQVTSAAFYNFSPRAVREMAGVWVYGALEIGLPCLSLYSLSTENRERPAAEIEAILRLFQDGLDTETEEVWRRDVRLRWSGVPEGLPPDLVRSLRRTEHLTRDRTGLTLNMCVKGGSGTARRRRCCTRP